jgi:hypothetical protein
MSECSDCSYITLSDTDTDMDTDNIIQDTELRSRLFENFSSNNRIVFSKSMYILDKELCEYIINIFQINNPKWTFLKFKHIEDPYILLTKLVNNSCEYQLNTPVICMNEVYNEIVF